MTEATAKGNLNIIANGGSISSEGAKASETSKDWGMGGDKSRALNAVTMAVTGALGGQTDLQTEEVLAVKARN